MRNIRYFFFCLVWLYRNREWADSRQKYKAMNREWRERATARIVAKLRRRGVTRDA